MGTPEKPVKLKVFVDKKKKKVMFAEAEHDFVDILFSFFTLPLGTVAKLSKDHAESKNKKVGSLTSLYECVVNLDKKHFLSSWKKGYLVYPVNHVDFICRKLKVNLDGTKPTSSSVTGSSGSTVFVKDMSKFIITDDLNVVPVVLDTSIVLFSSLGIENINLLEEITLQFGLEEFLKLLQWSLLTNSPLTNLVLGEGKPYSLCTPNSTLINSALESSKSSKTQTLMKLLVQKSNKKLLCAQVENDFVEMLFSFLTIPLGAVISLTKDDSSPSGIRNLYNSISCLGDRKYLKSKDVKTMLLFPKVADWYSRETDLLPIYEVNTRLNEQAEFIVFNDLEIIASPSALLLLKACITSTSALTDVLNASRKKPKVESST